MDRTGSHFSAAYGSTQGWAEAYGITAGDEKLPRGKAGHFEGVSVTMNLTYSVEERLYYLLHALGSMVLWSADRSAVQAMFDELRSAKAEGSGPRLELAIDRFRNFETKSSQHGAWLLAELGSPEVIDSYSNFMNADLESITLFHRTGRAPVWTTFFAAWNAERATGDQSRIALQALPIPHFVPQRIETQEILQQQAE